jgi:Ca2+-binding RTX toxin-like protein
LKILSKSSKRLPALNYRLICLPSRCTISPKNLIALTSAGTGNGAIIKGASSSPAAVNTLFGSAQNYGITGGSGSDILTGGAGQDTLTGGAGVDQFIYGGGFAKNAGAANVDRIADFVAGVGGDQFQFATGANNFLNGLNFVANTTVKINTAQTVATAADINGVFAGITAITASTNATLQAALVTVSAGLAAGTYLYANNNAGAVSNADDFLVNVSGISGTLSVTPTTGNFIFV